MAKPELLPVHIDGVQEFLRGILAVNELPFWDGTGIKDSIPGEKTVVLIFQDVLIPET